jgi:tetratricopeptide (TPR) repeat protein
MNLFTRTDVLRILHITPRQLRGWQRAKLAVFGNVFSFTDLIQLKKLRDLQAMRLRPRMLRNSLQAMRQVVGLDNPLLDAELLPIGSRVACRHEGRLIEPLTGQYIMDFRRCSPVIRSVGVQPSGLSETAAGWFARGVSLESESDGLLPAMEAYQKVLELDPHFAPAHINLGTIHYNMGEFKQAEACYRRAMECDPGYALACFNLGNVLDETGRLREASEMYERAVRLAPEYADAHYNLALALEKLRQRRKALVHWKAYLRLDRTGEWALHAKTQVRRTLEAEKLRIVSRHGREV